MVSSKCVKCVSGGRVNVLLTPPHAAATLHTCRMSVRLGIEAIARRQLRHEWRTWGTLRRNMTSYAALRSLDTADQVRRMRASLDHLVHVGVAEKRVRNRMGDWRATYYRLKQETDA